MAFIKSPTSDAIHAVRNCDGSQVTTILVFASCFVSVICALNGRKVMTWIMKKAKRTMI